jgi:hypothetical protein
MDEITYILGAGASSQSMPLVTSFVERFRNFLGFLKFQSDSENGQKVFEHATGFIEEVEIHLSFDTFFKKLFHQEQAVMIALYKKVLLLYFIYEHLIQLDFKEGPSPLKSMGKLKNLDPRYDALIAGLLEARRDKPNFFIKLNFITWNYDLNLFNSIKNFLFPSVSLGGLVNVADQELNFFLVSDQCSIIHLNGLMYHPILNDIKPVAPGPLKEMYKSLIDNFYGSQSPMEGFSSRMKFAWESIESKRGQTELYFITKAQEFIQKSKKIIIIGYSFPLYNRQIDLSFLNSTSLQGKTTYIQDPDATNLKSTFSEGFGVDFVNTPLTFCEPITDCKSFFVPRDVFI